MAGTSRISRGLLLVTAACWCAGADAQVPGSHFGAGVLAGQAAGLDDGYVHFGGFVPVLQPNDRSLIFADMSFQIYNESTDALGGNVGLGGRFFSPEFNRLFGGYVYYDRRDLGSWEVDQIGFGLESLGRFWDARLNVNLPTSDGPGRVGAGVSFSGSSVVLNTLELNALSVVEAEAGRVVAEWDTAQLKAFLGVYGLFDAPEGDTAGVRARLGARIKDRLWLGAYVEHDDVFDTTGGITAEWRFGKGTGFDQSSRYDPLARLGDPVVRRRHIAVSERGARETLTSGGTALSVTHVDGDSPLDATALEGSAENPHELLDSASGATTDIVFVHGGVYDGQALTVSHDGQKVFGSGRAALLQTDQGAVAINSIQSTVIRNSPSSALTINASEVTVSGFEIVNAGFSGIEIGFGATDVKIIGNTISGGGSIGIFFITVSGGSSVIESNTITGVQSAVLGFGNYTGQVKDNVFSANTSTAFLLSGNLLGDFTGNTVTDNGGDGVSIGGQLDGDFAGNTMTGNLGTGVTISGTVLGSISGNNVSDNGGEGFSLSDLDQGYVGNTTTNNFLGGVRIDGDVQGDFIGNTASGNGHSGVRIQGAASGAVSGNTANDNDSVGFYFIGDVEKDFTGNTANGNLFDGVYINGDALGGVFGNTANNNGSDGIQVDGAVSGATTPNTTVGNGDLGFRN